MAGRMPGHFLFMLYKEGGVKADGGLFALTDGKLQMYSATRCLCATDSDMREVGEGLG